jgi:hypothetical protein
MTDINNILNQSNYLDAQNFDVNDFNIDDIYQAFISSIDKIKSKVNISSISQLVKFDNDKYLTINSAVKPELLVQESRCHAFFRLLGFPVVAEDQTSYYNPGHDVTGRTQKKTINNAQKLNIANNVGDKFRTISLAREKYTNELMRIFSLQNSIDAGVLSLLSGTNVRKFNDHMQNADAFDFELKDQQYNIVLESIVGTNDSIRLENYTNVDGYGPGDKTIAILKKQAHYIRPFMVDPIIDFSISPAENRIVVPFVPDETYAKLSDEKILNPPLLETIIRNRFTAGSFASDAGSSQEFVVNLATTLDAIKDEDTLQRAMDMSNNLTMSEKNQFSYFLNLSRVMIEKLVEAQDVIKSVQGLYYWVPIPSTIGPEGGSKSHDVFISKDFYQNHSELVTELDAEIMRAVVKNLLNKYSNEGNKAKGSPNVLNTGKNTKPNGTFGANNNTALGDLAQQNLDYLTSQRSKAMEKAARSLQIVEMIMGEYSGLGLCDVIAITGALYIMPKGDLLGFLDADAQERMQNALGFTKDELALLVAPSTYPASIKQAQNSFMEHVCNFYNLMDKLYQDQIQVAGS